MSWKAIFVARNEKSIDFHLMKEYETEAEKWCNILKRILDVFLCIAEKGLAFFGNNSKIGDIHNGYFLGIIELLSKYDPVLNEHVLEKTLKYSHAPTVSTNLFTFVAT